MIVKRGAAKLGRLAQRYFGLAGKDDVASLQARLASTAEQLGKEVLDLRAQLGATEKDLRTTEKDLRAAETDLRAQRTAAEQALSALSQAQQGLAAEAQQIGVTAQETKSQLAVVEHQTTMLGSQFRGDYYSNPEHRTTAQEYWSRHNVTGHGRFASATESLAYFHYRNQLYPTYIEMLPVAGLDGRVILDYGCGPGNDLVGFAHFGKPARIIGIDISEESLGQAKERLALHGARNTELIHVAQGVYQVPLPDASVDYVHCSGVLMLIEEPLRVLTEFRRVLKPRGELRLMVYHYDSVWLHLYVAYILQLAHGIYADVDVRAAFSRTTDGEDCPLVQVWTEEEVRRMALQSGFDAEFLGGAPSLWELHLLPQRFRAALHPRLAPEHRDFLLSLEIDARGLPMRNGRPVGIDGCYRLTPKPRTQPP